MNKAELLSTVSKLCTLGKGILAADESTGTIGKRFSDINLENSLENRVRYRDLLFNTKDLNTHISGVITYEETLQYIKDDGKRLIQPLIDNNIVVGIKVDKGVKPLYCSDETVTQGIDDLDKRCQQYYKDGARFAKWRSVLNIDFKKKYPTNLAISQCANVLARYASICQNNGLVPIVEPEILMDGDHSIYDSYRITVRVLRAVYNELLNHRVDLSCTLLKPNMVRSGVSSNENIDYKVIAELTVKAIDNAVPKTVPGVVFLSGGMSEVEATISLNEINKYCRDFQFNNISYLTFSYGRALQYSVLQKWKGIDENKEEAQSVLLSRAKANGFATIGKYLNENLDDVSLHVKNYSY